MIISRRLAATIRRRARHLPDAALRYRTLDYAPDLARTADAAKVARRVRFLGGGGAQPNQEEFERLLGTNDLVDEFYLERALLAAQPVCRVSVCTPSGHERACATGFMVSPRLMLTNEHVLGSVEDAAPSFAEFNYRLDVAGRPEPSYRFRLRPDVFFFNDEALDFALVAVEPEGIDGQANLARFGYHRLIAESGKVLLKEWMNIIQHPGGNRRQFAIRENQCVKDDDPDVLWYKSDTAQGSSGSPVFNDSFQVVALHHAGVPRRDAQGNVVLKNGRTVADLSDADDAAVDWVANAGVRISRVCACIKEKAAEKNGCLAELDAAMQAGDVLSTAYANAKTGTAVPFRSAAGVAPGAGTKVVLGTLVLELNRDIGAVLPAVVPGVARSGGDDGGVGEAESYKQPYIDDDYSSRTGFNRKFLGISTPLPKVVGKKIAAPLLKGGTVIPYQHFSLVLHRERKLAIFTAANVDGSEKARRPEAGKDYTRKGLTGLSDGQLEKWALDPRVSPEFQIPDDFYTKDNGAFDKGHVVRREDVCFGETYAEVRRANGDSFHLTNCSPQRGNFNQSGKGGIWGNLENYIGAQADEERYCIFAGPVLSPDDPTFVGPKLRVKLPTRFWKVVCAVKNKKLQVFAFVLEQDTQGLPLEFQVNAQWKHSQVSVAELEKIVGLVKFPKAYHTADQA